MKSGEVYVPKSKNWLGISTLHLIKYMGNDERKVEVVTEDREILIQSFDGEEIIRDFKKLAEGMIFYDDPPFTETFTLRKVEEIL